jgi:hypothetical protein
LWLAIRPLAADQISGLKVSRGPAECVGGKRE